MTNWLSTLGGAHAALGQYSAEHAINAERMARRQYHVAMLLGDRALAARCIVFMASALIQQGKHGLAHVLITEQMAIAVASKDHKLLSLCVSTGERLALELGRASARDGTDQLCQ